VSAIEGVGEEKETEREEGVEGLSWAELVALPESYCTAWTCLFRNFEVQKGQRLVIRGGSSAFGKAAVNSAVQAGAEVAVTTRNEAKFGELRGWV
jgi:NADPH2:quinone reductase